MTTESDLRASTKFWRGRIAALEQECRYWGGKGDAVEQRRALDELHSAERSYKLALDELAERPSSRIHSSVKLKPRPREMLAFATSPEEQARRRAWVQATKR